MTDRIEIVDLRVSCILGMLVAERSEPQVVVVNLSLESDLAPAGRSGRIAHTVDYSLVAQQVSELLTFRAYRLVEAAAEEASAMLLGLHPLLRAVRVRIEKPAALAGRARAGGVSLRRRRLDYPASLRAVAPGVVSFTLLETREARLERWAAAAGATVPGVDSVVGIQWCTEGLLRPVDGPVLSVELPQGVHHQLEQPLRNEGQGPAALFRCLRTRL